MDDKSLSGSEKMRLLWWLGAVSIAKKHNVVLRPNFHHIGKVIGDMGLGRSLLHQVVSRVFPNFKILNTGSGIEIHVPPGPVRDVLDCVTSVKYIQDVNNRNVHRRVYKKAYPIYRGKLKSEQALKAADHLDSIWKGSLVRTSDEFRSMFITTFNRDNSMVLSLVLCEEVLTASDISAPAKLTATVLEGFDKFYWSLCTVMNELGGVSGADINAESAKLESDENFEVALTRLVGAVGAIYMAGGTLTEGVSSMWKSHEKETAEIVFAPRSEGEPTLLEEYRACRAMFIELGLVSPEGTVADEETIKNIFNGIVRAKFEYTELEEAKRGGIFEYVKESLKQDNKGLLFNNSKEYAVIYVANPGMTNFIVSPTPSPKWGEHEADIKERALRPFTCVPDDSGIVESCIFKASSSIPTIPEEVSSSALLSTIFNRMEVENEVPVVTPGARAEAAGEWDGTLMTDNFTVDDIDNNRVDLANVSVDRLRRVDPRIINVVNGYVLRQVN